MHIFSETIKLLTKIKIKMHLITSDLSKVTKLSKSSSMTCQRRHRDHQVIKVIENKKT